jgi:hypothetical protein
MDPRLGKYIDAGGLGSHGCAISRETQMSYGAGDNRRLFGVIGFLRCVLARKSEPRCKSEKEQERHEKPVVRHTYFYCNSDDTAQEY